jgi:hypothetical protein
MIFMNDGCSSRKSIMDDIPRVFGLVSFQYLYRERPTTPKARTTREILAMISAGWGSFIFQKIYRIPHTSVNVVECGIARH